MEEKAQAYLKANPTVKKLYGTQDGFLFERKQDAKNHAATLENKNVETFVPKSEESTGEVDAEQESLFDYEGEHAYLLKDRAFLLARYNFLMSETPDEAITTEDLAKEVKEHEESIFDGLE